MQEIESDDEDNTQSDSGARHGKKHRKKAVRRTRRIANWDSSSKFSYLHLYYSLALFVLLIVSIVAFMYVRTYLSLIQKGDSTLVLGLSRQRAMREARFYVNELVSKSGSANETRMQLQKTVNELQNLQNALAFGDVSNGISGSYGSVGAQHDLLFSDMCKAIKCSGALEKDRGRLGFTAALVGFMDLIERILQTRDAELSYSMPVYQEINALEEGLLSRGGEESLRLYAKKVSNDVDATKMHQFVFLGVALGMLLLEYVFVYVPMLNKLAEEARQSKLMFLLIPPEVLRSIPHIWKLLGIQLDEMGVYVGGARSGKEEMDDEEKEGAALGTAEEDNDFASRSRNSWEMWVRRLQRTLKPWSLAVIGGLAALNFGWWVPTAMSMGIGSLYEKYGLLSVTMVFGSFIAGSTPLGGGVVAFPVMSLALNVAPSVAREVAFLIQGLGMGAASILIMLTGIPIDAWVVRLSVFPGGLGNLLGAVVLDSLLTPQMKKVVFSGMWLGFAIGLAVALMEKDSKMIQRIPRDKKAKMELLFVSFLGGIFSGLSGSGIDTFIFAFVVLYYGLDERVAVPTSVMVSVVLEVCVAVYCG